MKKRLAIILAICLVFTMIPEFASAATPTGSKTYSYSKTLYSNLRAGTLTIKGKSTMNIAGCGLEIGKSLIVKGGSKIVGGNSDYGFITFYKGATVKGMTFYANVDGKYYAIKNFSDLWNQKGWNGKKYQRITFWWDRTVKAFVLPGVFETNSLNLDIVDLTAIEDEQALYEYRTAVDKKKVKTLSEKMLDGIHSTRISPTIAGGAIAGGGGPHINISWTKSKGYALDGYEIYRCEEEWGEYVLLARLENPDLNGYRDSKVERGAKRYYYKIRGYRYGDNDGELMGFDVANLPTPMYDEFGIELTQYVYVTSGGVQYTRYSPIVTAVTNKDN